MWHTKNETGNFTFEKATASNDNKYTDGTLSNKDFNLSIGSYKFLAVYNVGGNTNFDYFDEKTTAKSWEEILGDAKISRTGENSENLDVNEIFAFSSEKESNLSDAEGKVSVSIELDRVNSRIDVLVKKIKKGENNDETEIGYENSDVLGGAEYIRSITTTTKATNVWDFYSSATISGSEYKFVDGNNNIIVGTNNNEGFSTPEINAGFINTKLSPENIKKGTCYYKGAYVLPFSSKDIKHNVDLTFLGGTDEKIRNIKVENVPAQKNHISLITVKLITEKDEDDSDDKENIFNPNVQFTVTIDNLWAGVDNTDVEI